jgi:hypothetical protein
VNPRNSLRIRAPLRLILTLSSLICVGCGTLYLPSNHLESPEVSGLEDRFGHLEIAGMSTGTDLLTSPSYVVPAPNPSGVADPPYYLMSAPYPGFLMGMNIAVLDKLDVGIRMQPYAPLTVRAKYQLLGEPETRTSNGNLSIALSGGGGGMLGLNSGTVTFQYLADLSIFIGIRFLTHHLISASGFFDLTGVSGFATKSGSGFQGGGGLGYQLDLESFFIRAECSIAAGSYKTGEADARIFGVFPAVLAGFKL